ncbi:cytochrome ubiquinol oxidase subunit I [Fluviispira multicolorata]|uniref:Cytochrome ubiquinol oxidase subunit I n=1 Tax=Fluviispira multicolorata TaxID=2654512 RepID=A0A833JB92_9BACT|nr:cytochrome ubiquinol oxidase subunit I [Fluviispira multicolorata]KAB8029132.1 cytochrome ubiquinol oxidase subunit I [Fluviispira multicolorata]
MTEFLATEILARLQFALTIMFHYLFPPLSIGLGLLLVIMEGIFIRTKNPIYEKITKFWVKIYAANFAMGVATGLVMEFQFGTNWATYSRFVGDIFGSALAAEGIFAFFLESGFLAILVFGWDRVSPKIHFLSTIMVALGSLFSAIWIVIANAWMQSPVGFHIIGEGLHRKAVIDDFWTMVFNPSSVRMLVHCVIGCWLMGAFFVMSISSYYILKKRHLEVAKKSFVIALILGFIGSVLAATSGHFLAERVSVTQPAKLAAMEGHYRTGTGGSPLYLFGIPNNKTETVDYGIKIPGGLSFLVHGNFTTPVVALDQFKKEDRPPVGITFQSYHLMIFLGIYMLTLTSFSLFLLKINKLFESKWMMKIFCVSILAPVIANQAGWVATEVGRQPWIVYGLLRTPDGLSKSVKSEQILISIIIFSIIYILLFITYIFVVNNKIKHGPDDLIQKLK